MQPGKMHEMVKPLCWLIGTWKSISVKVKKKLDFPMSCFCPQFKGRNVNKFQELITFSSMGQPNLKYELTAWCPKTYFPLRLETGHLRVHEDAKHVTLLAAINYGMAAVEIGRITKSDRCLELCTLLVCNSEASPRWVHSYCRTYQLDEWGQLVYKLKIHTEEEQALVDYMTVIYEKQVSIY